MEELVAEFGSAFISADRDLTPEVRDDHAAYIASWIKTCMAWRAKMPLRPMRPEGEGLMAKPDTLIVERKPASGARRTVAGRGPTVSVHRSWCGRCWPRTAAVSARYSCLEASLITPASDFRPNMRTGCRCRAPMSSDGCSGMSPPVSCAPPACLYSNRALGTAIRRSSIAADRFFADRH
jgi:hypothetical protein